MEPVRKLDKLARIGSPTSLDKVIDVGNYIL